MAPGACCCARSAFAVAEHDRVAEEAHLVRDAERLANLRPVELDRAWAHAQLLRDLCAALPLADEVQNLTLPRGEAVERWVLERRAVPKAPPGDLWRDVALAVQHGPNGAGQLVSRRALRHEAMGA